MTRLTRARALLPPLAATAAILAAICSPTSGEYAGAYLEDGLGTRGPGMGNAFSAVVDDESAIYWNAARLTRNLGLTASASLHRLSLDRKRDSLAAAFNSRGGLAFGLAWIQASVGDLKARTGAGDPFGDIDDSENAFFFALGFPLGEKLSTGAGVKILRHRIEVPQTGASTATGRGLDLHLHYSLSEKTGLAAGLKGLGSRLRWTVLQDSEQKNRSTEDLPAILSLGAAHRPAAGVLIAADYRFDSIASYASLGGEWNVNPLLTVRAGLARIGTAGIVGAPTFGLTLRPMRIDAVQFHYAYVGDELDAGGRTLVGVGAAF